ncbi:MAG: FAD/NAD(P)-binding oxidoreductase, partial [Polaromonas sp.]|nr:FAD/NAD(P)-binding oxidoreductase [Gemmatimonadaceae bacterium]
MTAPALLVWIALAIVVQLGLGIMFAVREHGPRDVPMVTVRDAEAAWEGLRRFRVAARTLEDPSGSQCSFHLVPVDGLPLPAFMPGQFL